MHSSRLAASLWLTASLVLAVSSVHAQAYPSKPVRFLTPNAPATPPDIVARGLAQVFGTALGQPFFVENRVGANGIVGMEGFVRSAPDGYTLLIVNGAPVTLNPYFYQKLSYDPQKDLAPIVNVGVIAAGIAANSSVGVSSMPELIQLARAKPDTIIWANWGPGSFPDLYRAWAQKTFGVQFRDVAYKTPDQALNALVSGEVHVLLNTPAVFAPQVRAGKLKYLATIGQKRAPQLPETPSFGELSYDLDFRGWVGAFAPAGTPRDIISRLNAEMNKAIGDAGFQSKILAPNAIEPRGGTPEEFAAFIVKDRETAGVLTKLANVKPQ